MERSSLRTRRSRLARLLALLASMWVLPVAAEQLVVAVHPDSPVRSASAEDIASLYLNKRRGLDGADEVVPLDLRDRGARGRFYLQVTDRNLSQVRAYWSKLVFTGKGRPPRALSAEDMAEHLQSAPDAIGYLPASRAEGLRTLLTVEGPAR